MRRVYNISIIFATPQIGNFTYFAMNSVDQH